MGGHGRTALTLLAFSDLVAAAFVLGGNPLAGLLIDELLAQAIAGGLVDLPECDALGGARRMQRNRTGDQGEFEIAFPVGTHSQLLLLRGYATVSKGRDALFNPAAGWEPLPPTHFLLLLRVGGAPLRRARAKNRGPLQVVPVMARAMAERLA